MELPAKLFLFGAFFVSQQINPCESYLNFALGLPPFNSTEDSSTDTSCNKSTGGHVNLKIGGSFFDGFGNNTREPSHSVGSVGGRKQLDGVSYCKTGREQSPINIVASRCKVKDYPHVTFLDDVLFNADVLYENNCETVKITTHDTTLRPLVSGGPLETSYVIDNIHFHWGAKDTVGCEHTVDHKHFPMEAHLVLYKNSEKDFNTALEHRNVAVISFLFTLQNKTINEDLKEIVHAVTEVLQPHTTFNTSGSSLAFMKNYIGGGFYTYMGSLTTHTCDEGVLWIVFKDLVPIGHRQLLIFHDVIADDGDELQNWRKTLPLYSRSVWQTPY